MKSSNGAALLALALAIGCGSGSGPKPIVLDKPEATLPGTYGQINSAVELRDGRIALANFGDRTLLYARFDPAKVDTIGQHVDSISPADPAPGKYKLPGQVFHFAGDTVALLDFAAQRVLLWSEQGAYLGTVRLQPVGGQNPPVAYDTIGHAYKQDYRAVMGGLEPGAKISLDSAPVLRFPREGSLADTVARLKLPSFAEGKFGETTKQVATVYSGTDVFGVTPEGSLWVARAASNRVDRRTLDGKWSFGPGRPWVKIPVSKGDKDHFMDMAHANGMPTGLNIEFPFAEYKPPFSSAAGGPDGEVWLQRSRAFDDAVPVYDVVGQDGRTTRAVQLPPKASIIGFGRRGVLYVSIRGSDQRLTVARFSVK
jgi:hypothetical protein